MDSIKEVKGMGNIDQTIDDFCTWIQKEVNGDSTIGITAVADMITALAELIKARANTTFLEPKN